MALLVHKRAANKENCPAVIKAKKDTTPVVDARPRLAKHPTAKKKPKLESWLAEIHTAFFWSRLSSSSPAAAALREEVRSVLTAAKL